MFWHKFRQTFVDAFIAPAIRDDENEPGLLYQSRFAVCVALLIIPYVLIQLILTPFGWERVLYGLVGLSAVIALCAFRFLKHHALPSFLWFVFLVTLEAYRSYTGQGLLSTLFIWLPVSIAISCFLSGPKWGGLFTLIVTAECLAILYLSKNEPNILSASTTDDIIFQWQYTFIAVEIVGGIGMYFFAVLREKTEKELSARRSLRAELAAKVSRSKVLGTLAHELNNPLAILDAYMIRLKHEIRHTSSCADLGMFIRNSVMETYKRIEAVAENLRSTAASEGYSSPDNVFNEAMSMPCYDRQDLAGEAEADPLEKPLPKVGVRFLKAWKTRSNLGIRFLKWFIPPEVDRSVERFRSYIVVASIAIGTACVFANIMTYFYLPFSAAILWANVGLVVTGVIALGRIRLGCEATRAVPLYVISFNLISALITGESHSILEPGVYIFILFIIYGTVMSLSRWTFIQATSALAGTLYVFWMVTPYGSRLPFHWNYEQYIARLTFIICIVALGGYLCMICQDYFKRHAIKMIQQEKEWFLQSSRLLEISSLSQVLSERLEAPVVKLGVDLHFMFDRMQQNRDVFKEEKIDEISASIDNLVALSRSFREFHA